MPGERVGELSSCDGVVRYGGNPVLSAKDVPYDATLIFNAGVTKYQGKYVMVFRNDIHPNAPEFSCDDATNLGVAFSDDGIHWDVRPKPCMDETSIDDDDVRRVYDPRLTVIDGRCYLCFAVDTHHGLRGGIAVTEDFENFQVLSLSVPDNRNMVLFPERLDGMYLRLERPFPVYSRGHKDRFDMWFSDSPDLKYWGNSRLVAAVEQFPFANDKIGPGAPPIKTDRGWIAVIHTVDRDESRGKNGWEVSWKKRYCAGVVRLSLEEPWRMIGYSKVPLLAPEASYEIDGGLRNNVIFPGGAILEDDGEVKIYYGAADTVECLATASIDDLIRLTEPD